MKDVVIFYGHLVYSMVIWYILWSSGIFYGPLVYFMVIWYILLPFGIFFPFWFVVPRKIWQPNRQASNFGNGLSQVAKPLEQISKKIFRPFWSRLVLALNF
jgi:hypothetical protein